MIKVAAKQKHRATAALRLIFLNNHDDIVSSSRVRYVSERQGRITVLAAAAHDDKLREADAEDVNTGENYHVFLNGTRPALIGRRTPNEGRNRA